jgi:hypothetical protein
MICKKCMNSDSWPKIIIGTDGFCNFCRPKAKTDSENGSGEAKGKNRFAEHDRRVQNFLDQKRQSNQIYDAMVMWSGGKDSTNIIDRLMNHFNRRILAYTYDIPVENKISIENIHMSLYKLDLDYMTFANYKGWQATMKYIMLNNEKDIYPCYGCWLHQVFGAFYIAIQNNIKTIFYCADPYQACDTDFDDAFDTIVAAAENALGQAVVQKLYGKYIDFIQMTPKDKIPILIFPYVHHWVAAQTPWLIPYQPETIMTDLRKKGLYQQKANPDNTHCNLKGLLDWWAFKWYGTTFYEPQFSDYIRETEEEGLRERWIKGVTLLKEFAVPYWKGELKEKELESKVAVLKEALKKTCIYSENKIELEVNHILDSKRCAELLGMSAEELASVKGIS